MQLLAKYGDLECDSDNYINMEGIKCEDTRYVPENDQTVKLNVFFATQGLLTASHDGNGRNNLTIIIRNDTANRLTITFL